MPEYLSHLEAAIDGTALPAGKLANLHNGRPIWVRYDLDRIRHAVTPADIAQRPPTLWRYRELLPLPLDVEPVTLGEGMTPLLPLPAARQAARALATVRQGRVAAADRQLQEPRHDRGRQHGEVARREARRAADGRQRRRRGGRLRRPRRDGVLRLHAGRHAGRQPVRGAPVRREGVPRQRPHQRLRQDREGRRGADGLVRPLHAEGAVPPRRQEDDGPGTGRAARLDAAGRDPLPDRRRHRADRHVEGVRGARTGWLRRIGLQRRRNHAVSDSIRSARCPA